MARDTNPEHVVRRLIDRAFTLALIAAVCLAPAAVASHRAGTLCGQVTGRGGSQHRVIASRGALCQLAKRSVPGLTGQLGIASRGFGLRGPAGFHCLALPTSRPTPASSGSCVDPRRGAFSWQPARP